MRKDFIYGKPVKMAMLQEDTIDGSIRAVRTCLAQGADAFGLQLCRMKKEERSAEGYQELFSFMGEKPLYVTNYRKELNEGDGWEELFSGLLTALECGADLLDMPGNFFSEEEYELTSEPRAVKRQEAAIEEIHARGGKVLMSSHLLDFLSAEEVLRIALEQKRRGADVAKIVTFANSEKEMTANLETTRRLKEELGIPFLFLSSGRYYKIHRMIGPMLGSMAWLCASSYAPPATTQQPLLRCVSEVLANFDYEAEIRGER